MDRGYASRVFGVLFTSALLILSSSPALGWGSQGHRIIAGLATAYLDPATRQNLRALMGDESLASIATWADDIRDAYPDTRAWHYVNIPSAAGGYEPQDCPGGDCVVARIAEFAQVLGDPGKPLAERRNALKFLVHLVGDIHQPFHAIADAQGANEVPVSLFGAEECGSSECNLHGVWDVGLIQHSGLCEDCYVGELEKMISLEHLRAGPESPRVWADESFQLAKEAWVKPGAVIDEAYYLREKPLLGRQLALAGLRLARMLNEELGKPVR